MNITLDWAPSLRVYATAGVPGWRRVLAVADAAVARVQSLWHGLFLEVRTRLRPASLEEAIQAPNILEAHMRVAQVWEQVVERPARSLLPIIGEAVVEEAATAVIPEMNHLIGRPVTYTPGLVETRQAIDTLVGTQIRAISQTTLQTVRNVLQEGWRAGKHPRTLARELRQVLGLTPRQHQAIARQEALLRVAGESATQIRREVARLTQRALTQRALLIARTESLAWSNLGAYQVLAESVRRGYTEEERVRRQWLLTPGACPQCAQIPGMNPEEGVGLRQEFETPYGPLLLPPAHPACRCTTTTSLV